MIDYAARLTKVSAAIDAILSGGMQSYEIDGQKVTSLDLEALQREEARLQAKINRQAGRAGARHAVPR
jgi:hypothetical protein